LQSRPLHRPGDNIDEDLIKRVCNERSLTFFHERKAEQWTSKVNHWLL
jgi:hypothetical protein